MKIETKFEIGDIVKHKFEKDPPHKIRGYCVVGFKTETCYTGTQVFCQCRGLQADYDEDHDDFFTTHAISRSEGRAGYELMREDELVVSDKLVEETLMGGIKPKNK